MHGFKRSLVKLSSFARRELGRPVDITFAPFYILASERYSIYWDLISQEEWQKRQAAAEVKARREAELKTARWTKFRLATSNPSALMA